MLLTLIERLTECQSALKLQAPSFQNTGMKNSKAAPDKAAKIVGHGLRLGEVFAKVEEISALLNTSNGTFADFCEEIHKF